MFLLLFRKLLLTFLVCCAALALLEHFRPPQPPLLVTPTAPLVRSDYPVCVHVNPGPVVKRRGKVGLYPNRSETA